MVTWLSSLALILTENSCSYIFGEEPLSMLVELIWTSLKREEQSGQAQKQSAVMGSAWPISSKEMPGRQGDIGEQEANPGPTHSHQPCDLLRTSLFLGLSFTSEKEMRNNVLRSPEHLWIWKEARTAIFLGGWVRKGTTSNRWLHSAGLVTKCFPENLAMRSLDCEFPRVRDEGSPRTWHPNLYLAKQGNSNDFCCCLFF